MKSIVFFVTGLDSGGLENYLLRFLDYKAQEFDQIIVFCKGGKAGQLEKKYNSIPNVSIHLKRISFFNPQDYIYIYRFFKKNNINSVCDFTGNFAGLILLSAKWAGVKKRIVFYRGSTNHFKESTLKVLYDRFVKGCTIRNATNILSNSKAAFNFFFPGKWKHDSRFEVIYNGINPIPFIKEKNDLRSEYNIPKNAFVVGHTGRFNVAKNHATIIKVAIKLCRKYNDVYFLMCGNGVKDNLENLVLDEKLNDKIILSNNRSDIPKFLKTLDCFYFPSITEGQPNALIEALISGLPFVASNIEPHKVFIPVKYHKQLIDAVDVDLAVKKIEYINRDKNFAVSLNLKDWTIEKFNSNILFNQFYEKL
jgi:glycosyltransferase involved in cell wall biosynthesis